MSQQLTPADIMAGVLLARLSPVFKPNSFVDSSLAWNGSFPVTIVSSGSNTNGLMISGSVSAYISDGTNLRTPVALTIPPIEVASGVAVTITSTSFGPGSTMRLFKVLAGTDVLYTLVAAAENTGANPAAASSTLYYTFNYRLK